jgi:hypothetical protein
LLANQGLLAPGEKPEFQWYKDGATYDPEERFKVTYEDEADTLALVFQHVKPEDAGLYTCVAATSSGKISCSAELTVQGAVHHLLREPEAPSITMDLADAEVSCGGSAMLELKFKGFPKPKMVWTKSNGEVVTAGGRFRFLFEDEETIALIIKSKSFPLIPPVVHYLINVFFSFLVRCRAQRRWTLQSDSHQRSR